jgi:sugar phosphate isomerase/epimerase
MLYACLPPLKAIERIMGQGLSAELSYDNFAISGGALVEDRYIAELLKASSDLRGHVSAVHMPYDELEPHRALTESGFRRLSKWLDLARRLEIQLAVTHTLRIDRGHESALRLNVKFLGRIAEGAEDNGITVAVENRLENSYYGSRPSDLLAIIRELGGRVSICLDLGHAHINGNLEGSLQALGRCMAAMHVHDNDGSKDLHKPPYTGAIKWSLVENWLTRMKFGGVIVFEVLCKGDIQTCDKLVEEVRSSPIANLQAWQGSQCRKSNCTIRMRLSSEKRLAHSTHSCRLRV